MNKNGSNHANGKAPKPDALHVAFVLDESGSMTDLAHATVTGFSEFLDELRADPGDTLFSLTTFNTEFRHIHVGTPLAEVPPLQRTDYRPGGMTALFDAVAHTVLTTDERLAAAGRSEEKVMVVVMTDGLENSSTDYDAPRVAELIRTFDGRPSWTFVYLGAVHDTIDGVRDAADQLAFKRANAMRWSADAESAHKSMRSLGHAARHRRASQAMKSEQLFADARQTEADYVAKESGPDGQRGPSARRGPRDTVNRDSGDT